MASEATINGHVPEKAVRDELSRILESPIIAQSDRLVRFLRFTVDATLSGRADTLKEYSIGTEVYDRQDSFNPSDDSIVRSEARRLASRANYLYQEAGAQKVLLRLTFDFNYNGYFVTRMDPFAERPQFLPETGPAGVRVIMPVGIRIRDVTVEGLGTFAKGMASAQFYPGGYVDATMIHLVDEKGEVFTLAIDPFSGHVSIVNGDVSPPRGLRTYQ